MDSSWVKRGRQTYRRLSSLGMNIYVTIASHMS